MADEKDIMVIQVDRPLIDRMNALGWPSWLNNSTARVSYVLEGFCDRREKRKVKRETSNKNS